MNRRASVLLYSLCVSFSFGCAGNKQSEADRLFVEEIQPLFQANCTEGCHEPGGYNGRLFLGADFGPEEFVEVPSLVAPMNIVEPGNVDKSYIWHKLSGTHLDVGGAGSQMPYASPPLSDDQMALIEEYILALGD